MRRPRKDDTSHSGISVNWIPTGQVPELAREPLRTSHLAVNTCHARKMYTRVLASRNQPLY